MANLVFMGKTGLTGGEATKLDSIDGDTLADNDAAFVNVSNVQYIYRLDADSGAAESSPNIIAPDTNPGDKRWILQGLNGASLNMPGLTASLPVFTDGSKNLVSNTMTGTGKVVMDTSPTISAPTISGHPVIEGVTPTGATGSGKLVFDTSPTLVTPTLGAASGTSLTLSGLTASLPVFTDGSKKLVSKSVADTLTALGIGSSSFSAYITSDIEDCTGDDTTVELIGAYWTEEYDNGGVFSNGTFTAPATGFYLVGAQIYLKNIGSSHTRGFGVLRTATANHWMFFGNPYAMGTIYLIPGEFRMFSSLPLYLTVGATVTMATGISGGTKVIDILALATKFWGFRLK